MIKQTIHGVKKVTIGDIAQVEGRYYRNVFVYANDADITLTLFGSREDLELCKAADDLIPMDTINAPTDSTQDLLFSEALRTKAD